MGWLRQLTRPAHMLSSATVRFKTYTVGTTMDNKKTDYLELFFARAQKRLKIVDDVNGTGPPAPTILI